MNIIKAVKLAYEYKRYGEDGQVEETLRAVDGVDLDVKKGDFVAILGHNGSGKSTLAKQINALLVPTEGTLYVDGMDTKDPEKVWDIRQSAGMVFQNPDNQIIGTVVEEDVGFGPENMGVPTEEIWKRVDDSLKKTGMTAYRYQSPNKLSGGQKQRVAIAGVVAMRPSCIVLDEPTAMLDPNGRKEVLKAVSELNKKENVTVVLITHYMEEVEQICSRIAIIDHGHVLATGTCEELKNMIKTGETITIEAINLNPETLSEIRTMPNVFELTYEEQVLKIRLSGGKHNLISLLKYLGDHNISFGRVFSELPTLNDVFLEITGKELRD